MNKKRKKEKNCDHVLPTGLHLHVDIKLAFHPIFD